MRTKLLLLLSALPGIALAQAPIESFFGTSNANYAVVQPSVASDAMAPGSDQTWNFSMAQPIGASLYTEEQPTAEDIATFPNTTAVAVNSAIPPDASVEARIYHSVVSNNLSITGATGNGLVLNYNADNASIGTFPLSYGYNNVDNASGTFTFGEYAGTFTGTITSTVDASGTLTIGLLGIPSYSGPATRIKVVQQFSLSSGIFVNVGTLTQTSYNFYLNDADFDNPAFKMMEVSLNVPLLQIDQTQSIFETFIAEQLSVADQSISTLKISPNPVQDILQIELPDGVAVEAISITDMHGRVVRSSRDHISAVDVSDLSGGLYFLTVNTASKTKTIKFIKL